MLDRNEMKLIELADAGTREDLEGVLRKHSEADGYDNDSNLLKLHLRDKRFKQNFSKALAAGFAHNPHEALRKVIYVVGLDPSLKDDRLVQLVIKHAQDEKYGIKRSLRDLGFLVGQGFNTESTDPDHLLPGPERGIFGRIYDAASSYFNLVVDMSSSANPTAVDGLVREKEDTDMQMGELGEVVDDDLTTHGVDSEIEVNGSVYVRQEGPDDMIRNK